MCNRIFSFFALNQPHPRSTFVHLRASLNRRRRAAVKVRLIHSEHFFLSPKARKKPGPQKKQTRKKYVQSNIFVFCFEPTLPLYTFGQALTAAGAVCLSANKETSTGCSERQAEKQKTRNSPTEKSNTGKVTVFYRTFFVHMMIFKIVHSANKNGRRHEMI